MSNIISKALNILRKKESIFLGLIIILATLLRFINYDNRWGLAADQARDVLVVRGALAFHTVPLIGPFSASGPFVFGPFWYWIFMVPVILFPNSILAPWIFQGILYVCTVFVMFFTGKKLVNSNFGLLAAFFTAVSPAATKLSTNIIMSSLVGIFSFFILFFFVRFLKEKKLFDLLSLSFLTGFAINIHPEAIPLTLTIIFSLIFGKRSFMRLVLACIFFIIPFTPLIIFNVLSHNYELTNIFHTHKQLAGEPFFSTYARQFILFLTNSFPNFWQFGLGGYKIVGYFEIIALIITGFFAYKKNLLQKDFKIIMMVSLCMIGTIAFYNGTLFRAFFSFFFPFIIILTSWLCFFIFKLNKYIGTILVCVLFFASLSADYTFIVNSTNDAAKTARYFESKLDTIYPNSSLLLYNYQDRNKDKSLPLSLFLDVHGKLSRTGKKIGFAYFGAPVNRQVLIEGTGQFTGLRIYNLDGPTGRELLTQDFKSLSPRATYNSVENWWK